MSVTSPGQHMARALSCQSKLIQTLAGDERNIAQCFLDVLVRENNEHSAVTPYCFIIRVRGLQGLGRMITKAPDACITILGFEEEADDDSGQAGWEVVNCSRAPQTASIAEFIKQASFRLRHELPDALRDLPEVKARARELDMLLTGAVPFTCILYEGKSGASVVDSACDDADVDVRWGFPEWECTGPRLLMSLDMDGLTNYIKANDVRNVVVLAGAGISTSAGIPDFRTPGSGLYSNLEKYALPDPTAMFTLDYFRQRPEPFLTLTKAMWPGQFKPTASHSLIALLHKKGVLRRVYTQNIDCLEELAGVPRQTIVPVHGDFSSASVVPHTGSNPVDDPSRTKVPLEEFRRALFAEQEDWQEWKDLCAKYGGLVKPDIVFFGEGLPRTYKELHVDDLRKCDLLIVMGTSLVVGPVNEIVGLVRPHVPRVLVNRTPSGLEARCPRDAERWNSSSAEVENHRLRGGFRFGRDNYRDVFLQGDCDAGAAQLAAAFEK